jgi:hypothetical protein
MTPPAATASRTTAGVTAAAAAAALTSTVRLAVAARLLAARRAVQRPASPAALAKRLVPGYVITLTIALLSDVLADAVANPDRRVIVSTPPRTRTTARCRTTDSLTWTGSRSDEGTRRSCCVAAENRG